MSKHLKRPWPLRIDSRHRLMIGLAVSTLMYFFVRSFFTQAISLMIAWNSFVTSILLLVLGLFIKAHPMEVKRVAGTQDSSRTFIFLLVVAATIISVLAIFVLLGGAEHLTKSSLTRHVLLAVLSLVFSWMLLHTMFSLRYAHLFYKSVDGKLESCDRGLEIPGETNPDYMDFAYFSFVIGMTFQVSDIQITGKKIRRLVLVHSLISFAFNTIIVALSINVISGMIAH